ncbi:hypothetical protein GCM10009853_032050 [Glycomyces scopariae]
MARRRPSRRTSASPPADAAREAAQIQAAASKKGAHIAGIWGVVAASLAVIIGGAIGLMLANDTDSPSRDSSTSVSQADDALTSAEDLAIGAFYEVAYTDGLGVDTYEGPSRDYPKGTALQEGVLVRVQCQDRTGESITEYADGDASDRYDEPWPVWDLLSTGMWVPDLFVSTPKVPGDQPPADIPLCE